jgi:hypothetical protein
LFPGFPFFGENSMRRLGLIDPDLLSAAFPAAVGWAAITDGSCAANEIKDEDDQQDDHEDADQPITSSCDSEHECSSFVLMLAPSTVASVSRDTPGFTPGRRDATLAAGVILLRPNNRAAVAPARCASKVLPASHNPNRATSVAAPSLALIDSRRRRV